MTLPRLFPSSFMRSHATDPHDFTPALPLPPAGAPAGLANRTVFVSRSGEAVRGMGDLHRALADGWRIVAVHPEAAPKASPLDFSIRVSLAMTEHHHVGSSSRVSFGEATTTSATPN